MKNGLGKKQIIIITVSIVTVLLIAAVVWAIIAAQQSESEPDPFLTQTASEESTPEQVEEAPAVSIAEADTPTIDESTVSYVAVEPLAVEVAYVKGVPGFEFSIERTQSGLSYVDFSSPDVAGTKCTDDEGVFASVIENPQSDGDRATVTTTKKVGDTSYGLSLPENTCTDDPELFAQYQQSFKDAFGLLRALPDTAEN